MLDTINSLLLKLADPLLGWLLHLPRDVVLIVVALGTAVILTGVRVFTSNQDLLRRCSRDKKRLAERIKATKRRDDSHAVRNQVSLVAAGLAHHGHKLDGVDANRLHRLLNKAVKRLDLDQLKTTKNQVAVKTLCQEGWPLLVSLPLIALIAVWAFARISFYPPEAGTPVTISMYLPKGAADTVVHLVPQDGLSATNGWVRTVDVETDMGQTYGVARWAVQGDASEKPYPLQIKHGTDTYAHELLIGQRTYTEPLVVFDDRGEYVLEIGLEPYKPFGGVPGLPWIHLAPWIVGYLLLVIPFVPLFKRLTRVY